MRGGGQAPVVRPRWVQFFGDATVTSITVTSITVTIDITVTTPA